MGLSEEKKKEIIDAVKLHVKSCPICNRTDFELVDGYLSHSLQQEPRNIVLGGQILPMVALVCKNCGYVAHFSSIILKLIKQDDNQKETK